MCVIFNHEMTILTSELWCEGHYASHGVNESLSLKIEINGKHSLKIKSVKSFWIEKFVRTLFFTLTFRR